jgi:hypothetical protein
MIGFYSIWEMAIIAHTNPNKLIVCFLKEDKDTLPSISEMEFVTTWSPQQIRSIAEIMHRCGELNVPFFWNIFDVHQYLRQLKEGKITMELHK